MTKTLSYLLLLSGLVACSQAPKGPTLDEKINAEKDSPDSRFPEALSLSQFKSTEVVPTLENQLSAGKNSIYAPAFLYAWNEIQQMLKSPVMISVDNSRDFKLINESMSYQHALEKSDYLTEASDNGDGIVAKAYFRKFIPFAEKFDRLGEPLSFGNEKVTAFGIHYSEPEKTEQIQIMYYKDDDHFVVKLIPKDKSQEIILSKGISLDGTFTDLIFSTEKLIGEGLAEAETKVNPWKYSFGDEDELAIPIIGFNLATNYPGIEGQHFTCKDGTTHFVAAAEQRIAFVLDESGAAVESFAMAVADSVSAMREPPRPQNFIFDKPYLMYVKPMSGTQPYFVMKVENAELMKNK